MADEYTGAGLNFEVSEEENSYGESIGTDQWSPSVTLRCLFENRYALITRMRGRTWPHATGTFRPIATGFSIEGSGVPRGGGTNTDTQLFTYTHALVTCNYEQVAGGNNTNPNAAFEFFTETIEPTIEYLRLPHHELFFPGITPSGGAAGPTGPPRPLSPEQTPGLPVYRERYMRTYVGISLPLFGPFTSLQNRINTNAVASPLLGVTYDPLTVLYGNRRVGYSLRTDGSQSANLSLEFTYRQETWRKYWDFDQQDFLEIQNANGDPIAFPPEADLSPVLLS